MDCFVVSACKEKENNNLKIFLKKLIFFLTQSKRESRNSLLFITECLDVN